MIWVRDSSTVMASDDPFIYSVRVILGLGLEFDLNDLLTLTSKVNLNHYNPNPPN